MSNVPSPIITEQEQLKILANFKEYEKILNILKEQKKKEKEAQIRKEILEKEKEIEQLEEELRKKKEEKFELESQLIIEKEQNYLINQQKKPKEVAIPEKTNLYLENGDHENWNNFKNGKEFQQNNGWGTPYKQKRFEPRKNMCSNCDKEGHYFQNCPNVECGHCRGLGHIQRYCPEKTCEKCGDKGHIPRDCKSERKPLEKYIIELNDKEFEQSL